MIREDQTFYLSLITYHSLACAAVCAPLGVEGGATGTAVIHRARKPVGDEGAYDEDAAEDRNAQ